MKFSATTDRSRAPDICSAVPYFKSGDTAIQSAHQSIFNQMEQRKRL